MVTNRVDGKFDESVDVIDAGEHAWVAVQQVGRRIDGPAPEPVVVGPGAQTCGETGEGVGAETVDRLYTQGFVGEQEYAFGGVQVGAPADGAAEHTAQEPVDCEGWPTSQLLQVAVVQATATGSDQAQYLVAQTIMTIPIGGQDLVKLVLSQFGDPSGVS